MLPDTHQVQYLTQTLQSYKGIGYSRYSHLKEQGNQKHKQQNQTKKTIQKTTKQPHAHLTDSGWEGHSEGKMSKQEFLDYLEGLEQSEASMRRQVLSDGIKGYFSCPNRIQKVTSESNEIVSAPQ